MQIDPATTLALIAELYGRVAALTAENEQLRALATQAQTPQP